MKLLAAAFVLVALAGAARANGVGDMWNDAKNTTKAAAKDSKKNAHDMFKRDKKKSDKPQSK
ncbi:MAG TPA: hypothetical protein VFF06_09370 [Polyangia bacterium]|nr:hypothetical protein [Polyangia bacterium]